MAAKLKLSLLVDDKGSLSIKNFSASTQKSIKAAKVAVIGLGAGLAAMTAAIGVAVRNSMQEYGAFETALVDMGRVTAQPLGDIKRNIMAIDPVLGSSTELMKGYYQVISAGVTEPKAALDLLKVAAMAGNAAHVEQSETIKGLTKVMAGYKGEIETATGAADLLFQIEKQGQTSFAELIPVIGGLAAMSKDLGIKQEELGGSLAQVSLTAGSTAEAATQYQSVLTALMKPSTDMSAAFKEMGYESSQAAIKNLGFSGTLQALQKWTGGSAEKMAKLFGRVEALKGMSALASGEFKLLNTQIKGMGDRAGGMDKAFAAWGKTFAAVKKSFFNTIGKIAIDIGTQIAPTIKKAMATLSGIFEDYRDNIKKYAKESAEAMLASFNVIIKGIGFMAKSLVAGQRSFVWIMEKASAILAHIYELRSKVEGDYTKGAIQRFKILEDGTMEFVKSVDVGLDSVAKKWRDTERIWKEIGEGKAETIRTFQIAIDGLLGKLENYKSVTSGLTTVNEQGNEVIQKQTGATRDLAAIQAYYNERLREQAQAQQTLFGLGERDIEQKKLTADEIRALALAGDDFFVGMKIGFLDILNSEITWATFGSQAVSGMYTILTNAGSDFVFTMLTDAQDIQDVWKDLTGNIVRMFSNMLAQMATQWAASSIIRTLSGGSLELVGGIAPAIQATGAANQALTLGSVGAKIGGLFGGGAAASSAATSTTLAGMGLGGAGGGGAIAGGAGIGALGTAGMLAAVAAPALLGMYLGRNRGRPMTPSERYQQEIALFVQKIMDMGMSPSGGRFPTGKEVKAMLHASGLDENQQTEAQRWLMPVLSGAHASQNEFGYAHEGGLIVEAGEGVATKKGMKALDQLNSGGSIGGPMQITIPISIAGQEVDRIILNIADDNRVQAERRGLGTRRAVYAGI